MKIVEINMTVEGSTGNIMLQIAACARNAGYNVITCSTNCSGRKYKKLPPVCKGHFYYSTYLENYISLFLDKLTGYQGCFDHFSTWRLIRKLNKYKPDLIHLHNIHSAHINLGMLFRYIKRNNIKVVWTLHDCWCFTGQCPHFTVVKCEKWKTGCYDCPQVFEYPKAYVDRTREMWKLKKKWFTSLDSMVLVTPSVWLKNLVQESYMKKYQVKVINNGIDLSIYKPTESDFRKKYKLFEKKIVLGVCFSWGYKKGLDIFIDIAGRLDDNYQIVLVGVNKEDVSGIPDNIITIARTNNQIELAQVYSAADVFFNPTREDTYSNVNMEALACGTPVITFKSGGSAEMINSNCGVIVAEEIDHIIMEIKRICEKKEIKSEECVKYAQKFDRNKRFEEYIELYADIE